ncbi:MAG: hypothetical protein IT535_08740 [Bauldia sp.]|nr:hypothetical protein [Bauldia sp.]
MIRSTLCTLLATGIFAGMVSPTRAVVAYDGRWSIQVVGQSEKCEQNLRLAIRVDNGAVEYAGWFNVEASGEISPNGNVNVRVAYREDVVDVSGAVSGDAATGSWTSPTLGCSGIWRGERA